jgi:hypothetical protein
MRILDTDHNKAIKNLNLYLTIDEAKEMLSDLKNLINKYGNNEHTHINDAEYEREIRLVIYNINNLNGFDVRSKKLITDGE